MAYYVISCFPQFNSKFALYVGPDCVDWFLDRMLEMQKEAITYYFDEKRLVLTPLNIQAFHRTKSCWLCDKLFDPARPDDKVRDHDHITGEYRGAAHKRCNIRTRRTCKLPIFFHNLRGYDGHFITRALSRYPGLDIKVIGQGMEKYLTLSIGKYIVFKDSYQFLGSSLSTLADNLAKCGLDKFEHLRRQFPDESDENFKLLVRKGVYPYEYMDSVERFNDSELPPKEAFFSKLNNTAVTDEDYAHAQNMWRTFNLKNMRDYHDLYLKSMSDYLIL